MFHRRECHLVAAVVILFLAAATSVPTSNFVLTDCGSLATVHSVTVNPCLPAVCKEDEPEPCAVTGGCQLRRETNHYVNITLTSSFRVLAARHDVQGNVFGMYMRLPGMSTDRNACLYITGGCPIPANTQIEYSFPVPIQRYFPEINTNIRYTLTERARPRRVLVCFELAAQIK